MSEKSDNKVGIFSSQDIDDKERPSRKCGSPDSDDSKGQDQVGRDLFPLGNRTWSTGRGCHILFQDFSQGKSWQQQPIPNEAICYPIRILCGIENTYNVKGTSIVMSLSSQTIWNVSSVTSWFEQKRAQYLSKNAQFGAQSKNTKKAEKNYWFEQIWRFIKIKI